MPNNTLECILDLRLNRDPFATFAWSIVFPIQFVVVIMGNCLTLAVLLSGTVNRANRLLACLALCDCCVFVSMVPNMFLACFEMFYTSNTFRHFYYTSKLSVSYLVNWFLAASIWFVLAISLERLLIIKFPFRSLNSNQRKQVIILGIGIIVFTGGFTSVHLLNIQCGVKNMKRQCNSSDETMYAIGGCATVKNSSYPEALSSIISYWMISNIFIAVLIPVLIVIAINISLIRLVKRSNNNKDLVRSASTCHPRRSDEQEKSMTRAIVAIVSCFSLTQAPSAIVYFYNEVFVKEYKAPPVPSFLWTTCTFLVLTGKMLNVVLFCLTSATFRSRLISTVTRWCYKFGVCKRPPLNREVSRSLLTQKTSVASFYWRGKGAGADSFRMSARPKITADNNNGTHGDNEMYGHVDNLREGNFETSVM